MAKATQTLRIYCVVGENAKCDLTGKTSEGEQEVWIMGMKGSCINDFTTLPTCNHNDKLLIKNVCLSINKTPRIRRSQAKPLVHWAFDSLYWKSTMIVVGTRNLRKTSFIVGLRLEDFCYDAERIAEKFGQILYDFANVGQIFLNHLFLKIPEKRWNA